MKGYRRVVLMKNGKQINALVHRLIAQTFIPNPENKPEVNHKDGNKENNSVFNLEWCTHKENVHHAIETGLKDDRGTHSSRASCNEEKVKKIRSLISEGKRNEEIAKIIGVSKDVVRYIRCNRTYKEKEREVIWMWSDVERTNNTSKEGKVPYTKFEAGSTSIRILDNDTKLIKL